MKSLKTGMMQILEDVCVLSTLSKVCMLHVINTELHTFKRIHRPGKSPNYTRTILKATKNI